MWMIYEPRSEEENMFGLEGEDQLPEASGSVSR